MEKKFILIHEDNSVQYVLESNITEAEYQASRDGIMTIIDPVEIKIYFGIFNQQTVWEDISEYSPIDNELDPDGDGVEDEIEEDGDILDTGEDDGFGGDDI